MAAVTTQINPVNWFEIPVQDIARAKKFFETTLGFRLDMHEMGPVSMAWFPMNEGAPGAAGSLVQGKNYVPSHGGTIIYFSVDDIEEMLRRISANGGKTLIPKTNIGEYGFFAHFEDSEGNRLGLHSMR